MKKLTRKEKIALQQQAPEKIVSKKKVKELSRSSNSLKRVLLLFVGVFAFLIYSNTLNHQYVLDDFGLIPENLLTKKGISAWPEIFSSTYRAGTNLVDHTLYRPLSKAMFALEWQLAPNSPELGHWINVLFFSFTCIALFALLSLCLQGNLLIPFITALFFAAHPIHTEVVANIKSRDEIMCLFFCILAAYATVLHVKHNRGKYLLFSGISFFLAMLSKESAITWLAVIPLVLYFFAAGSWMQIIKSVSPIFISAILFLLIRSSVISGESGVILIEDNYLVGIKDFMDRQANAIFLLGIYLKQLLFPVSMISDGSFNHFKAVNAGNFYFLLSLAIFLLMGIFALMRIKKRDLFSFCVLYFLITISLVSNVLFLIGTNYGERLLFIPSLGFCLALAGGLYLIFPKTSVNDATTDLPSFLQNHKFSMIASCAILVFYSVNTYGRNKDWYDNTALYGSDILKVPESVHMQFYYANHLSSDEEIAKIPDSVSLRKTYETALQHLEICTDIHPRYADAYQRKGFIYHKLKNYVLADENYLKAISINPTFPVAQNNYANLLFETRRYNEALKYFSAAFRLNPHYSHAASNIASVYGVFGEGLMQNAKQDPARAAEYTQEAHKNFRLAVQYFEKSIQLDPEAVSAYRMLSVTYASLGDQQNASKYASLAEKVQRAKK